jgi:hypothetical protein
MPRITMVHMMCRVEQRLDEGLTCLAALPALTHLSITGDRDYLQAAVSACGPLSRLTQLTRFEMAPPTPIRKAIHKVWYQPVQNTRAGSCI